MIQRYDFAPLDGITKVVFRQVYHRMFGGADRYFIPFFSPTDQHILTKRDQRELDPAANAGLPVVPQVMTCRAPDFLWAAEIVADMGYTEVNLNLGCPSKTVVSKGRGSGFLADPDGLDRFLDEIFKKCDVKISIKTRIGKDDPEEFARLLDIYNQYPVEELIIHPRVQKDFYKNQPNLGAFHDAVEESKIPLCYNGDIFTPESYEEMKREFPQVDTFMLGRGILMNPALLVLFRMRVKTDVKKTTDIDVTEWKKEETSRKMQSADRYKKEIHAFLEQIKCDYLEVGMGEKNTLFKLKELWAYMGQNAPEAKKALKRIRKSQSMADYDSASREALEDFILF